MPRRPAVDWDSTGCHSPGLPGNGRTRRIQQNANATSSKCVHKFKDLLKNRVSKMQTMQKSGCSAFVDCCYYAFLCCQVSQVYAYEDHLFLIFLTSLLINSFCLPTHQCETENVAFLHQKNKTKKTIRLFLPAGLCSRTPRGLWTRALASRLCTGRTAASCRTRTCSSCSPTSGSTLVHLLVLQTKQKKQKTPPPSFTRLRFPARPEKMAKLPVLLGNLDVTIDSVAPDVASKQPLNLFRTESPAAHPFTSF